MPFMVGEQHPPNGENYCRSIPTATASPAIRQRRVSGGGNMNIKALSRVQTSAQWKESLRKSCLERVKLARRDRLWKSRLLNVSLDNSVDSSSAASSMNLLASEGCGNNNRLKRGRDEELDNIDWSSNYNDVEGTLDRTHGEEQCDFCEDSPIPRASSDGHTSTPLVEHCDSQHFGDNDMLEDDDEEEGNMIDTARALVEQELQRALSGVQQCRDIITRSTRARDDDIDYSISHEEYMELLNDVTEELQREGAWFLMYFCLTLSHFHQQLEIPCCLDELLEEEIWEMERAEAMERERLMHQIDDFEAWEELEQQQQQHTQPSTYTSPFQSLAAPRLTCPICNSSSLMESPQHGIICTSALGDNPQRCTFQLNIAQDGLTLHHLQTQLGAIYEEHSQVCLSGQLHFRIESRAGVSMLMAKCNICSSDVVVL